MTSFGEALRDLAAADPGRPAVTCGGERRTREELERRSNRLARTYAAHGVTAGDLVSIALPNSIDAVEATVATWKLGATPQPLSARLPAAERAAVLDLVRPALVVGVPQDELAGHPSIGGELSEDDGPLPPQVAPAWKAPTSGGSTGRPKVIVAEQPAELEFVAPYGPLVGLASGGEQLCTGPLHHNGPFMFSMIGLLTGGHLVVMPRFDAEEMLRLIEQHKVDWAYSVPTMLHRVMRLPKNLRDRYDLSSLRTLVHMAAPCPVWLKEQVIDWLGPQRVLELYAGTEAQAATVIRGDEWLTHRGSVGRPAIGEVQVHGDDGAPVPPGVTGRLWLRRGPGQPAPYRYLGAEPRADAEGWETLGDLGHVDEDGYVYITDRDSDMLLVGGSNVYPAEVEAALEQHPAVRSSCVVGVPHDDLGTVPHAVVETDDTVTDAALLEHCRALLAPYKVPRGVTRSSTPLRDDGGKVRRPAVRAEVLGLRAFGSTTPPERAEGVSDTNQSPPSRKR